MRFLIFIVFLPLVVAAQAARGDDGAITGVGGTIELLQSHPSIALADEFVHARLLHAEGAVEVESVFVLVNQGDADSVLIGFPELSGGDTLARPFSAFRSYVDGIEVPCTRVPSGRELAAEELFWWTKRVYFAKGQTHVVRDTYRSPAGVTVPTPEGARRFFSYELWTGASWAGPIGTATIVFSAEPCDSTWSFGGASPAPTAQDGCEYRWQFSNFDPGRQQDPRARDIVPSVGIDWLVRSPGGQ
jgi:hypothetical protein